jgi:hypothetical protein
MFSLKYRPAKRGGIMPRSYKEAFQSKYMKATDFVGKRVRAVIHRAVWEEMPESGEEKVVVYFKNGKAFVPNNGCCQAIEQIANSEFPENWGNSEIVLTTQKITKGKYVGKYMFVIELPEELKPKLKEVSWDDPELDRDGQSDNLDDIPF